MITYVSLCYRNTRTMVCVLTNTLGDISIKLTSEPIQTQPEIFSIPVFEVFVDLLAGGQNFPSTLTPIHRFSSHFLYLK